MEPAPIFDLASVLFLWTCSFSRAFLLLPLPLNELETRVYRGDLVCHECSRLPGTVRAVHTYALPQDSRRLHPADNCRVVYTDYDEYVRKAL